MLPGLFRTLVGLVVAWFVFRFLDRIFGGRRRRGHARASAGRSAQSDARSGGRPQAAKDDHLGEYVDYEEVEEGKD